MAIASYIDSRALACELMKLGLRISLTQEITGVSENFLSDAWRDVCTGRPGRLRALPNLFATKALFQQTTGFMYCLVSCLALKRSDTAKAQALLDAFRMFVEMRGPWVGSARSEFTIQDAGLLFLAHRKNELLKAQCRVCHAPAWLIRETLDLLSCPVCKGARSELRCDELLARRGEALEVA